ncbi:MAG: stage II sporulation protein E [Defluviitaleaceae bacterium]|nr:stage II sporulation protein E [Defluviitaleaceae bacterium]
MSATGKVNQRPMMPKIPKVATIRASSRAAVSQKEKKAMPKNWASKIFELRFNRIAVIEGLFLAMNFFAARVLIYGTINPFGIAYLSAFMYRGNKFYLGALFAIAGVISQFHAQNSMGYLLAIIFMCILNLLLRMRPRAAGAIVKSGSGALCALIAGLGMIILRGQGLYFIMLNFLETGLIFAAGIVLFKGINCLDGRIKRGSLNNEEIISIAVVFGLIAAGSADINIWVFSLRYFFVSLIILLTAQAGGSAFGATIGVILGFLLHISGFEYIYFAVLLAAAGFGAGAMRENRLISLGIYLVTGLLCILFFDTSLLMISTLVSAIAAGIIFYFIPSRFLPNIHFAINPTIMGNDEVMEKVNSLIVSRIEGFATGYQKLANSLKAYTMPRTSLSRQDINHLLRDIRMACCDGCPKEGSCWEGDMIKKQVLALVVKCGKKGEISIEDAPLELGVRCINVSRLIMAINREYEICCINFNWRNRLIEARGAIGEQLSGAARVMENFAGDLRASLKFHTQFENEIMQELTQEKIDVRNVIVLENGDGKFEISITQKTEPSRRLLKIIEGILEQILEVKLEFVDEKRIFEGVNPYPMYRLEFAQQPKFAIGWGIAGINKDETLETGDSFSYMDLRDGRTIMALSDGMGSGARAQEESRAAIELLEEFMENGFDRDTTIKLINLSLLLKSSEDLFSTLDICTIDRDTAAAEFIKIGASSTVLLRDGETEVLDSWSLPVGILDTIDMNVKDVQLGDGDVVVMMTDGVLDSDKDADADQKEEWIMRHLKRVGSRNAQEIAEYLLDKGKKNYGEEIMDDMTVLVGRVYQIN